MDPMWALSRPPAGASALGGGEDGGAVGEVPKAGEQGVVELDVKCRWEDDGRHRHRRQAACARCRAAHGHGKARRQCSGRPALVWGHRDIDQSSYARLRTRPVPSSELTRLE